MSMFVTKPGSGGGGGSNIAVINDLKSTSPSSALSANMGRVLNENMELHAKTIASTKELGHVKVDGKTITIDPVSGVISSKGGDSGGNSVTYAQAIIPTTIVDQQIWKIPFSTYKYPDDLLIVTRNSTVVDTDSYSITQNSDGVSWDVNIPMESQYSRPVDENTVFVIMVKGGSGGSGGGSIGVVDSLISTSTVDALSANMGRILNNHLIDHEKIVATDSILGHVKVDDITIKSVNGVISVSDEIGRLNYEQAVLPTTEINQKKWTIPFTTLNYPTDLLIVSHNTTFLSPNQYKVTRNISNNLWELSIDYTSESPVPIDKNQVYVIAIKSAGRGSGGASFPQPAIKKFIAETLDDPVGGFHYKIESYIPQSTDIFEINFNTTSLNSNMYTLSNDGMNTYIKLLIRESDTLAKNNIAGTIYRNFDAF